MASWSTYDKNDVTICYNRPRLHSRGAWKACDFVCITVAAMRMCYKFPNSSFENSYVFLAS